MKLLEHFKELTTHPKNAQELKGLILQLAIEGKLTKKWREENPDVEPASILLERLKEGKAQLVKEKTIKEEKKYPSLNKEKSDIPESWTWCQFSDIVINRDGERRPITKSDRISGEYDYYGASGIIDKVKGYIFDKELLLIGEDGANLIARSTPIAFFAQGKYWVNNHAHVIDAIHFEILKYLEKYINGISLEDYITGMAQPKMPQKRMNVIPVALPPLEEQKAIVAVVDELFKEIEELELKTKERIRLKEDYVSSALQQLANSDTETEWPKIQEHFKTFFTEKSAVKKLRETILQLAVQGKLTKHWRSENPNQEHAKVLLEKIKAEKALLNKDKKIKPEKPLPAIKKEEIPYELPEGWVWCRIGDALNVKSSKRVFKSDYVNDGVPFFRSKEIGQLGRGQAVTTELYISRLRFEEFKKKFGITKAGDILIACIGGSIGNTWLVDDREFYYKDGNLVQVDSIPQINSYFLLKYFDSKIFYDSALGRVSGSAYNALTIEKIKNSLIPLPSKLEQLEVVNKVNTLMIFCDELEKEIEQSMEQVEALMKSCVREVLEF